jgi:hypothetical protein
MGKVKIEMHKACEKKYDGRSKSQLEYFLNYIYDKV